MKSRLSNIKSSKISYDNADNYNNIKDYNNIKKCVINKYIAIIALSLTALIFVAVISLLTGQYPLSINKILAGNKTQIMVLKRLRIPRTIVGITGGFGLGLAGYIYQIIFKNPLASPDIAGVSSGASAGAAFAIVIGAAYMPAISLSAFAGALIALILTLIISNLVPNKSSYTIVLAGIAIHSLAQTLLMILKLAADPEKQLASIEYWIMGSLNAVTLDNMLLPALSTAVGFVLIILFKRQLFILALDEAEAEALGADVKFLRMFLLIIATFIVSSVICTTGLISFIGLIAPHIARLIIKDNNVYTLVMSGLSGSLLLTVADILARSVIASELPVSIFTSVIGAPLLILLLIRMQKKQI